MNKTTKALLPFLLSVAASAMLVGCGNSEDGPILSDEEKIKQAGQGREQQMGQQGGASAAGIQGAAGQ
ncbi:hypothetical protein EON82_20775 [bacterium]|nr:MAG: hypothetical protein EON82_20775 [bacterium]